MEDGSQETGVLGSVLVKGTAENYKQAILFVKTHLVFFITLLAASLAGFSTRPPQALTDNKATILRSEAELWNKRNLAVADELYLPNLICHFAGGMEWRGGRVSRVRSRAIAG